MDAQPRSRANGDDQDFEELPYVETYGLRVRPEVARQLAEMQSRIARLEEEVDRATAEFNRPRGIMGKLFGLRTHVG